MAKSEKPAAEAATKTPSKAPPARTRTRAKSATAHKAAPKVKKVEKANRVSPLGRVKDKFQSKQALVDAVAALAAADLWLPRTNVERNAESEDAKNTVSGLKLVSNAKLLRLHTVLSAVKEKFGTRDKLIGAILEIEKRTKDEGYKSRLSAYPVPRLFDYYKAAQKRSGKK